MNKHDAQNILWVVALDSIGDSTYNAQPGTLMVNTDLLTALYTVCFRGKKVYYQRLVLLRNLINDILKIIDQAYSNDVAYIQKLQSQINQYIAKMKDL